MYFFFLDQTELGDISQQWDVLVQSMAFPSVFALSGFAKAWWSSFGRTARLRLAIGVDDTQGLRVVAPFYYKVSDPHVWYLVGNSRGDYNDVICKQDDVDSLIHLFSWLSNIDTCRYLVLTRLPASSPILKLIPNPYRDPRDGEVSYVGLQSEVPSLLADLHWHHLHPVVDSHQLSQLRTLLERRSHRRRVKALQRVAGEPAFRSTSDPDELRALLPKFVSIHVREWDAKGHPSLFCDTRNQEFYYSLISELSRCRAVRIDSLSVKEKIVAAHFGFCWNQRLYYYKPCYNPEYAKVSPGKMLLEHMIVDGIDSGLEEIELLRGVESYKSRYTSTVRRTISLCFYHS